MTVETEGAAERRPRAVQGHRVKFRVSTKVRTCRSEACAYWSRLIAGGEKYARVLRDSECGCEEPELEAYHAPCYDYEFGRD